MSDPTPIVPGGFLELVSLLFLAVLGVASLVAWVVDLVRQRRERRGRNRDVEFSRGVDGRLLADDGWVVHRPVSRVVSASCPLRVLPHHHQHEILAVCRERRGGVR